MRVRFWGTRGSLPAPADASSVRAKIRSALVLARGRSIVSEEGVDAFIDELPFSIRGSFGGNTSCVQIVTGEDEDLLCDAGSGLRVFGAATLAKFGAAVPRTYNIVMSHRHWDHIMGFPFFTPAYVPGNTIRIYGCHPDLREAFERQHGNPSFPIPFAALGATIEFVQLAPGKPVEIAGCVVTATKQQHGGDSYGYRFERNGKVVVYSTDSQHSFETAADQLPFVEMFRAADIVVFDAMYSLGETVSVKEDWGHSSNVVGVELAHAAGAKHLVLFHHEPVYDDAMIERVLNETRRFEEITRASYPALRVSSAYDGMELEA